MHKASYVILWKHDCEQRYMRVVTVIPQVIETVHSNIQGGLLIHGKSPYIDLICGLS